jgi:hypothetical protein
MITSPHSICPISSEALPRLGKTSLQFGTNPFGPHSSCCIFQFGICLQCLCFWVGNGEFGIPLCYSKWHCTDIVSSTAILNQHKFVHIVLLEEFIWLGLRKSEQNCTLCVQSQIISCFTHSSATYHQPGLSIVTHRRASSYLYKNILVTNLK